MLPRQLESSSKHDAPFSETINHVVHFNAVGGGLRPSPRSGHAMVTCKHLNAIFLFGGLGHDVDFRNDMWRMDLHSMTWSRVAMRCKRGATMPQPVFGLGHVLMADDRRWFMYGGLGSRHDEHFASVHVFDLDECMWLPINPIVLRPLWGHSISSVRDGQGKENLVIFGGMEHDNANDRLYVLDGATLKLLQTRNVLRSTSSELFANDNRGAAMKLRRRHGACVYKDVFVLVACGRNLTHFINDMWCYNFLLDQWVPLSQASSQRSVAAYFAHPTDKVYGEQLIREYLTAMNIPGRAGLSFFSTMTPRTGVSMFLRDNLIYVFGGFFWAIGGSCSFNDMHVYDIENHCWFQAATVVNNVPTPPPQGPLHAHSAASKQRGGVVPTTMTAICPIPSPASWGTSFNHTWLMFGGRWGNVPLGHQYTLTCKEPRYPLSALAALWLKRWAPAACMQAVAGDVPPGCQKQLATAGSLLQFTPRSHVFSIPFTHDDGELYEEQLIQLLEENDEELLDPLLLQHTPGTSPESSSSWVSVGSSDDDDDAVASE